MLNSPSLEAIATARTDENLGHPLYDSYCFSQIPSAIADCLTGSHHSRLPADSLAGLPSTYDKVILLLIDGFGWRFIDRFGEDLPLLRQALNHGVASKLTTQFPSTTSVHVTTIHTGLPVGKSGIVEWNYYEPSLDRIIASLPFSFYGDNGRETMAQAGVDPATIFPVQTFYHQLQSQGIPAYVFQHHNYAQSSYSKTVCDGATMVGYRTVPEAIATLNQLLSHPGKGYYLLYIDSVDAISHRYGPSSPQTEAEVQGVLILLESLLYSAVAKRNDTLMLVTADHGQIDVSEEQTIYLEEQCSKLLPWVSRNAQGELLVPSGGPRDFFLHVRDEALLEAEAYLAQQLEGIASVVRTKDFIDQGYFGDAGALLQSRLSNLIILPHKPWMIRWHRNSDSNHVTRGHHGGLTAEEMEIPLLAIAS